MKEALKLALEALETCCAGDYSTGHVIDPSFDEDAVNEAITAIKEALAQPAPPFECRTEEEKTAFAFGWWKALETQRMAQPEQEVDWKDQYEKQKRRAEMWLAKYEEVAGPAPMAYPLAQPDYRAVKIYHEGKPVYVSQPERCQLCNYQHGHAIGCKNNPVDKALAAMAQPEQEPVLLNGLTEAETNSSASVMGLTKHAQPEQEPVAWTVVGDGKFGKVEIGQHAETDLDACSYWVNRGYSLVPLYTTPPRRPWVGLTDDEASWCQAPSTIQTWKRIEAKLKELNT